MSTVKPHRRSPIAHKVSGHYREGQFIDTYKRGKGKRPKPARRRKPSSRTVVSSGNYNTTILHQDGEREEYDISTTSYRAALQSGLNKTQKKLTPIKVTIRGEVQ